MVTVRLLPYPLSRRERVALLRRVRSLMLAYLIRRIFFGAFVLLGTSLITFVIAFKVPADPAVAMAGAKADPHTLATIRHQLHLDEPIYIQYGDYLARALHGDLGRSYIRRESVTRLILSRFPATALLAVCAMALSLILGIALGLIAAAYRDTAIDNTLLVASLAMVSMPVFWLGTMLLIAAASFTRSIPLGGLAGWKSLILADHHARARLGGLLLAHPAHQSRRGDGAGIRSHRDRQGPLARASDDEACDGRTRCCRW